MSATPATHVPHLDGWRGLAILMVLIGHFAPGAVWMGPFGVSLFFVLSGRLMGELLFIKEVALPTFFFRRASRILPTFWLFVLVMFVYAAYFQPFPYQASLTELFSTLLFMRTYLPPGDSIFTRDWPIGHLWSLNVEEHSYMFLALIALLCRRAKSVAVTASFLVGSIVTVVLLNVWYIVSPPGGASPWYIRSETAALGILAGAGLWFLRLRVLPGLAARVPAVLPVLTFLIAVACMHIPMRGLDKVLIPLCLAVSMVFIDRLPAALLSALSFRPLRWMGVTSFSMYLWQQAPFVALLQGQIAPLPALLIALVLGTVSYYAFENPLREAINARWARRKSAAKPALHHA